MAEMTVWNDPVSPAQVEISSETAEQLRLSAVEGLLSLPRVGVGIGGVLLGHREDAAIKILEAVPIACSHATGPSFVLTAEETEAGLAMARQARTLTVVGCYCSKPRGFAPLTETDRAFFEAFCPEPWQVMLFIRPATVEPSRTLLWFRDKSGSPVQGTERELKKLNAPASRVKPEIAASVTPTPPLPVHSVPQFVPAFAAFNAPDPEPDRAWIKTAAISFLVITGAMTLFYLLLSRL